MSFDLKLFFVVYFYVNDVFNIKGIKIVYEIFYYLIILIFEYWLINN